MEINLDYQEFKSIINIKEIPVQYVSLNNKYIIFGFEGPIIYFTDLFKEGFAPEGLDISQTSLDLADFEGNLKEIANQGLIPLKGEFTPTGATKVTEIYRDLLAGTTDDVYLIPSNLTLILQRVFAASSLSLGTLVSSKVELFEDVSGDGSSLNLLTVLYTTSNMVEVSLNAKLIGDGSRSVRVRRTTLDTGAREVFTKWEGYLESKS